MNGLKTSTLLIAYVVVIAAVAAESQFGSGSIVNRVVEMLAFVSALLTCVQFDRDDPPRRPWMLLALALALVPIGRIAGYLSLTAMGVPLQHPALIASNLLYIAAVFNFGQVLRSSGLVPRLRDPENRSALRAGWAITLGVAAIIVGIIVTRVNEASFESARAWSGFAVSSVSSLGDGSVFVLGLYLVWLVRPLLGGSVARPYVLVATGGGIFIVTNILHAIENTVTQDQSSGLPVIIAATGWLSFALAGMAQSKLLQDST